MATALALRLAQRRLGGLRFGFRHQAEWTPLVGLPPMQCRCSIKLLSALRRRHRAGDEHLARTTGSQTWVGV
jgi:hypothetical protein